MRRPRWRGRSPRRSANCAATRWQLAGGAADRPPPTADGDCWPGSARRRISPTSTSRSRARSRSTATSERGARDRGAVPRADRAGEAAHLCREPVFRLAPDRRGDRAAARRARRPRDRHRQPARRRRAGSSRSRWIPRARGCSQALQRRDRHGRLRMYHPFTAGGEAIYVHAKVLVDRRRGDPGRLVELQQSLAAARYRMRRRRSTRRRGDAIAAIRDGLIAEHLGVEPATVIAQRLRRRIADRGDRGAARQRTTLIPYEVPELSEVEKWLADNEVLDPEGPDEMFEAPPQAAAAPAGRARPSPPLRRAA